MIKNILKFSLFFSLINIFSTSAFANKTEEFRAQYQSDIVKIEEYLNSITTLSSEFLQISSDNHTANGKFYMERPGKFRWDYNEPMPVLIIANKGTVIYYEKELDQVNYIPIEKSVASMLVRKKVSFSDDIEIVNFVKNNDSMKITFRNKNNKDEGNFSLIFKNQPLSLGKIEIEEAEGKNTSVTFYNTKFGEKIDPKIFEFNDPRLK